MPASAGMVQWWEVDSATYRTPVRTPLCGQGKSRRAYHGCTFGRTQSDVDPGGRTVRVKVAREARRSRQQDCQAGRKTVRQSECVTESIGSRTSAIFHQLRCLDVPQVGRHVEAVDVAIADDGCASGHRCTHETSCQRRPCSPRDMMLFARSAVRYTTRDSRCFVTRLPRRVWDSRRRSTWTGS